VSSSFSDYCRIDLSRRIAFPPFAGRCFDIGANASCLRCWFTHHAAGTVAAPFVNINSRRRFEPSRNARPTALRDRCAGQTGSECGVTSILY
jgi:hypothetical protein